ncbi:ankyrin repeat domain-containing protein [Stappia indica]|uniref:ankyrin repeat domain-containing protein n=1 Tax=Stappia indica TaxID=538381 RepID=UPI001AD93E2F|nr:ankyrin repeat domain-containing protein [Stappia indica]
MTSALRTLSLSVLLMTLPHTAMPTAMAEDSISRSDAAVMAAARADDLDTLKQLAEAGLNLAAVEHAGTNLATIAAMRGSPDTLAFLAAQGVDLNLKDAEGYTPVMRALQQARTDNALKLRELGASLEGITEDGYSVRVLAEVAGLEDFGPEPPPPSLLLSPEAADTILLKAAEFGDLDSVRFALDHGANVSARAANGWTPLMIAALGGHADIVRHLVAAEADEDGPLPTVDGKVDAVVAALVGGAKRDESRVDELVCAISHARNLAHDMSRYRMVASRLGYSDVFQDKHFPTDDLPPLEIDLPFPPTGEPASWRVLQSALRGKGLYQGTIDGVIGDQSLIALHYTFQPLFERLVQRSATAAARAQEALAGGDRSSPYGEVGRGISGETAYGQKLGSTPKPVYFAEGIDNRGRAAGDEITVTYQDASEDHQRRLQLSQQPDGSGFYQYFQTYIAGGLFSAHVRGNSLTLSFNGERPRIRHEVRLNVASGSRIEVRPLPGASLSPFRPLPCLPQDPAPIILDSASSSGVLDAPAEPRSRLLRIDEDPPAPQEPDAGSPVQDASEAWER